MTIEEYRKKSEQGGFDTIRMTDSEVFLNPKSFQAVGKVEGWEELPDGRKWESAKFGFMPVWKHYMYAMIDALCDGKTIEQFIATL